MVLFIISLFVFAIIAYYLVCHIIKLWTGCDYSEAVAKLHNFINGKVVYSFENDLCFANDVWDNVKKIIGDKRFEQLLRLSQTSISTPLLSFGVNSGLPYIAVSLYFEDDNEKQVIENILTNLVKKYLNIYGYSEAMLVSWKKRYDLGMPYLEIRYSRNNEEKRVLDIGIKNNLQNIVTLNSDVVDDEDIEDLE